jgi:hypothetical protein
MDQNLEAKAWRRGFASGFLALALSVGAQIGVSRSEASHPTCPLAASEKGLAEQVIEHIKPTVRSHGVAQRVALAVLGAMLHGSSC